MYTFGEASYFRFFYKPDSEHCRNADLTTLEVVHLDADAEEVVTYALVAWLSAVCIRRYARSADARSAR